ncbi:ATP-binding protein [Actinoplanes sp. Pm04-4]|uniref:ATP-binding protein n=1 Tax=Paractinoplanes pyxinae TaxID=2997416 RepID=A0ABT4BCB2_9ACTN|nr:ATP-binding protein [Actinoplanes pyxinae]MCY1144154.1 ATP-binding protein [Actinoplanes pyxinae]
MLRRSLPSPADELHCWLPRPGSPLSGLRAELRQLLTESRDHTHPVDSAVMFGVPLAATELISNAWQHGRPPVKLRLLRTNTSFIIDVVDHHPGAPPAPRPLRWSPSDGYGLHLIRHVASMCGWTEALLSKHIWASFHIDASRAWRRGFDINAPLL